MLPIDEGSNENFWPSTDTVSYRILLELAGQPWHWWMHARSSQVESFTDKTADHPYFGAPSGTRREPRETNCQLEQRIGSRPALSAEHAFLMSATLYPFDHRTPIALEPFECFSQVGGQFGDM